MQEIDVKLVAENLLGFLRYCMSPNCGVIIFSEAHSDSCPGCYEKSKFTVSDLVYNLKKG